MTHCQGILSRVIENQFQPILPFSAIPVTRLRRFTSYNNIRRLHLWLALSIGLLFVVAGLSGSIIAFDHALDERLNPSLLLVSEEITQPRLSYDTMLTTARAYATERGLYVSGLQAPRLPNSTQMFWMRSLDKSAGWTTYEIFIHPYNGKVLGQRTWGEYFTSFVYMFHHTLWLGKTGKLILGYCAIGMLLMLFSGLYVWWPRGQGEKRWRAALTLKRKAGVLRRLLDFHRVVGVYGLLTLVVVVSTGIYAVFPEFFRETAGATPMLRAAQHEQSFDAAISVEEAISRMNDAQPESRFNRIYFGNGKEDFLLTLSTPEDPRAEHGYNRLTLDPSTGEVREQRRWSEASNTDLFFGWMFPLHSGDAFGQVGRIIVLITGLLPTVLMVTGCWRWLRKRRHGKALRKA